MMLKGWRSQIKIYEQDSDKLCWHLRQPEQKSASRDNRKTCKFTLVNSANHYAWCHRFASIRIYTLPNKATGIYIFICLYMRYGCMRRVTVIDAEKRTRRVGLKFQSVLFGSLRLAKGMNPSTSNYGVNYQGRPKSLVLSGN